MQNNRHRLYIQPFVSIVNDLDNSKFINLVIGDLIIDSLYLVYVSTGNCYLFEYGYYKNMFNGCSIASGGYQHCINMAYRYFNTKYYHKD